MNKYLDLILKKSDEIYPNVFNTKELRERFENLNNKKKIKFNNIIWEELFNKNSWENYFVDDVFEIIYKIFDEAENM